MAVTDTSTDGRSTRTNAGDRRKRNWFKKNKALTVLGGGAALLLVLAHNGKNSATTQAEEQAALEQQRAALENGNILPSGSTAGSGSGGGESSGNDVTSSPTSPIALDQTSQEDLSKLTGAIEGIEATAKETPTSTQSGGETVERPEAKATPASTAKKSKTTPHKGHGVTVNGRFFAGATGSNLGPVHRNAKGETSREVTIYKGGKTERFISHNGGKSWTDKPRGTTPPSPKRASTPHHSAPSAPARKPAAPNSKPAKPKPVHRTAPKHRKPPAKRKLPQLHKNLGEVFPPRGEIT